MARGTRRGVVAVMTLGGAIALTALAGCSAAPETTGETDEALPRGIAVGGGAGGGRVVEPPVCRPHGEHPYTPPAPVAQGKFCLPIDASYLSHRGFEPTNTFEAALQAAGCTNDVQALGGGPAIPPGGVGWSYATCPDSCTLRALINQYHPVNPFGALTSDVRISGCSGVPAAGTVFAVWDPRCPSSCQPVLSGGI